MIGIEIVADTAEDEYLLELSVLVYINAHWMIAHRSEPLRFRNVNCVHPRFLFKQEQVNIIKIRYAPTLAHLIISTAGYDQGLTQGQVFHTVACSSARRIASDQQLWPVHGRDFVRLQVQLTCHQFHFITQFSVFFSTTEKINAFHDGLFFDNGLTDHTCVAPLAEVSWKWVLDGAALWLDYQVSRSFGILIYLPTIVFNVKAKYFWAERVILVWASVDNHSVTNYRSAMIFPRIYVQAFRMANRHSVLGWVVYQHLICILSDLPLMVVIEAASKYVDLVAVSHRSMATPSLQFVIFTLELFFIPVRIAAFGKQKLRYVFVGLEAHSSDKVHSAVTEGHGRILFGWRHPARNRHFI